MINDYGGTESITEFAYSKKKPSCRQIVTVNSFYRLTEAKLTYYKSLNIDLIDMEAAALNYVSKSKGACFEPLFVVSDKINPDLSWQYENKSSRLKAGIEHGLQQLLE
jgi:purine-nucleoside phosphorylase